MSNKKDIKVCYGIDVDAVAGWLGSYGGEDSPCDISRGIYAARKGVPQLLELLDKYDIKATFFVPGHTIETFPDIVEKIISKRSRNRFTRIFPRESFGTK